MTTFRTQSLPFPTAASAATTTNGSPQLHAPSSFSPLPPPTLRNTPPLLRHPVAFLLPLTPAVILPDLPDMGLQHLPWKNPSLCRSSILLCLLFFFSFPVPLPQARPNRLPTRLRLPLPFPQAFLPLSTIPPSLPSSPLASRPQGFPPGSSVVPSGFCRGFGD